MPRPIVVARLLALAALVSVYAGCTSARATPPSAPAPAPAPGPTMPPSQPDELTTPTPVTFQVRGAAPGAMGPTELAPASEAALKQVADHLAAHPEIATLTITCHVNRTRTSSTPDPRWAAGLGQQVARGLVQRGVDCKRLAVVGVLDTDPDSPAERVSFHRNALPGAPSELVATADPCAK